MKVINSNKISAFGGINFIFEHLNKLGIDRLFKNNLPEMAVQSRYTWKDIIYSLHSIYYCGGDSIEDLQVHLRPHFEDNPLINMPSADTVLRRLKQLSVDNESCTTKRGLVEHTYNFNKELSILNIYLLKKLGAFNQGELTLDYDNTILFNEKQDSKMTYKRNYGYQPGVCTVNEDMVLYLENRNGNSDAKSFQTATLTRMFNLLEKQKVKKVDHFRADAASHQYEVIELLNQRVENFYIGCRNSYVEKYFSKIKKWEYLNEDPKCKIEVGEIIITPFQKHYKKGDKKKTYRLIVKRSPKKDRQTDLFTNSAYQYRAIITNNNKMTPGEIAQKYNRRGNMEKQFDIMKNDYGWNNMPFSNLSENTVFLYFMAMCRNLYKTIIEHFSKLYAGLNPTYRIKKFIFRFIILPVKWVVKSRQYQLRVYGKINFRV